MSTSQRIFPVSLLAYVAAAVLVVVIGLAFFAQSSSAAPDKLTPEAIAARLAPVAMAVSEQPVAAATGAAGAAGGHALKSGEAVYGGLCVACHGTGAAGAPKFGDAAAWKPRIAQGFATLVKHATEGYKAMPPKGGGADLDPQEVARAVAWMANHGGASFKEP